MLGHAGKIGRARESGFCRSGLEANGRPDRICAYKASWQQVQGRLEAKGGERGYLGRREHALDTGAARKDRVSSSTRVGNDSLVITVMGVERRYGMALHTELGQWESGNSTSVIIHFITVGLSKMLLITSAMNTINYNHNWRCFRRFKFTGNGPDGTSNPA